MKKKEFIEKVKFLMENEGNVVKFIEKEFDKLLEDNMKFSLNDTIYGTLSPTGVDAYNKYYDKQMKAGDRVHMQLHTAISMFTIGHGSSTLPLLNCSFSEEIDDEEMEH